MFDFILKYWVEFIFGIVAATLSMGFKRITTRIHERAEEQKQIKKGLIAILHDRLFQSGMYFLNKGEITVTELDNMTEMYKAYNELGGNSTGTEIFERVQELTLKK